MKLPLMSLWKKFGKLYDNLEEFCLLGCDTIQSGSSLSIKLGKQTCLLDFFTLKMEVVHSSKMSVNFY
jgi:hypothetical protein